MKYACWRHEGPTLGNSAEHMIGLYKHLLRTGDWCDPQLKVYVEHEFQKHFALCIPFLEEKNIEFFPKSCNLAQLYNDPFINDIYFPNVYRENMSYPAGWADLSAKPDVTLQFPYHLYENKHNLPKNAILVQIREAGTFDKRHVGANEEPDRFVNIETFFEIAEYYANCGHTVIRLGDKNQTPMPKHENIIDFAMEEDKTILDDLYLIQNCKLFISCDSGVWPMAGGMKKNLVLCNITSSLNLSQVTRDVATNKFFYPVKKSAITDWLPKETSELLFKTPDENTYRPKDNSIDEIFYAAERFLK